MAVKIFFSYVHEDQELLNKLKAYLEPLQQEGLIDMQHDSKISTGEEWAREIDRHLSTAQIILLLVSQYSLNSDYFYNIVIQRALERHERGEARVIPILLRPVYYQRTPFATLQALPTNAKPVTMWQNQEAAFLNIVQGIRNLAKASAKSIYLRDDRLKDQIPLRKLPVISQVTKTSPDLIEFSLEEQITEIIRSFPSYVPSILSSGKVDPNSPVTIPYDLELHAIYDELSSIH